MITFEDFKKMEIKVARIIKVQDHPNADKLYIVELDTGNAVKNVVAGIKPAYSPDELIGKYAILVDNLEPAKIRGVESHGMILAAKDDKDFSILTLDKPVKLGSPVS